MTAAVHRFEESIAGRAYLIEVAAVTTDRWRAYIVRVPGVPTALMPFYGATPAEAARPVVPMAHPRSRTRRDSLQLSVASFRGAAPIRIQLELPPGSVGQ